MRQARSPFNNLQMQTPHGGGGLDSSCFRIGSERFPFLKEDPPPPRSLGSQWWMKTDMVGRGRQRNCVPALKNLSWSPLKDYTYSKTQFLAICARLTKLTVTAGHALGVKHMSLTHRASIVTFKRKKRYS